jgi:diguanylate cyclase (GGDEF)-like protein/PAS domain S-box-containing protein
MSFPLLLAGLPAIAALISGCAMIFCWQRRETPGARAFSLFTGCIFIWCFFAVFEQLSRDEAARIIFGKLEYIGIVYFPIFWLIFTLQYTHNDARLSQPILRFLIVLPTINLGLAITDPWHGLIWRRTELVLAPFPSLKIEHGWWFSHVMMPFQYLLLMLGIGVLLHSFFANSALYRRQILILLSAALIPFGLNVLYIVAGISFYGLDMTPIGLAASGIIMQLGLFKGRLLDASPISYRTVFLNTTEAVILLDARHQIVDLNPSAYSETGRQASRVIGRPFQWGFPDYRHLLLELPAQELTRVLVIEQQGAPRIKEVKIRLLRSPGGRSVGWAVIIRDITLERKQQNELKRIAYLDGLTGLCNRRQLEITATKALEAQSQEQWPIALIYLDLNAFKPINDTYGHEAGDAVLIHVANCLKTSVRKGDIVARLGGDEFVALLFRANRSAAGNMSDRLKYHLRQSFDLKGQPMQISASIGIACFPEDGQTLRDLLHLADQDMYQQKHARRT